VFTDKETVRLMGTSNLVLTKKLGGDCSSYVLEDKYFSTSEIFLVAHFLLIMLSFQVKNMLLLYATTEVILIGLLDGFWLRCVVDGSFFYTCDRYTN